MATGAELKKKFVSEVEIEEKRRARQEEWEKVRNPEDPQEAPEEEYDPRCLFEKLQEQKDKKQEEYEEQFRFKNMVKGLDEDESSFLDEVSRQQSLVERQRRQEDHEELTEYRSALKKLASNERREPERRAGPKDRRAGLKGAEPQRTSHLSQAHLLAGAVRRRSSSQSSENSKKPKLESTATRGPTEQESGGGGGGGEKDSPVATTTTTSTTPPAHPATVAVGTGAGLLLPSATVCVGILPGLGAYSGSSDSESSTDSEV